MAKAVNPGEMTTRVTILSLTAGVDSDGFPTETWGSVFSYNGNPVPVRCKWVNAHGTDVFLNMQLDLKDVATLTMRYSPLINQRCRVLHEDDPNPYEIISIDNVDDSRAWMEIKVKRLVIA